jgi:hypothetical protein
MRLVLGNGLSPHGIAIKFSKGREKYIFIASTFLILRLQLVACCLYVQL